MQSPAKYIYITVCVLIIIIVAAVRIHLADIPFERDEGEYAYAGQLILKGDLPYKDVYNMKFPGVYYMYAFSFKLFGEGITAPRYLVLLLQLSGSFFLFLLARRAIHPLAGWLSASVFMLFNLSLLMQGTQTNAEHFLVAFLTPSLYFLYRGAEKKSISDTLIAGILISFACMMKQHAIIFAAASMLWLIYMRGLNILRYAAVYITGVAAPLLLMFLFLWYGGVWDHFYFLTFQYARAYVGLSSAPHVGSDNLMNIYNKASVMIWCSVISLTGLFIPGRDFKTRLFIILFLLASIAALAMGLYFRPHYFLYLLPVFSLLFAYSAFAFVRYIKGQGQFVVLTLYMGITAFMFLYIHRGCFFFMPPERVIEWIYPGTPFSVSGQVASFIRQHSATGDRICMLGAEPQIFFLSQRRSASGYIYIYPLLEQQKYAPAMTDEFIKESEQAKPAILLYSNKSVFEDGANHGTRLYHWFTAFKNNYKLISLYTAKSGSGPLNMVMPLVPADTLSDMIPQIRVYKRVTDR